jgi:hypothetical protein
MLFMPPLSTKSRAQVDAAKLLDVLGPQLCGSQCTARVLGKTGAESWIIRLSGPSWQRCFKLDLTAFGYREDRGLSGLSTADCR